jgi:DNA-directed RNA polymerase specialized sigma24 family protein
MDEIGFGQPAPAAVFATTHWSVVLNAGGNDERKVDEALARLCHTYWYPLYAYVRRQGHPPEESRDLTQEFFARLLARNYFRGLDRQRGRFRSFLLAAMEHFLAKEWRDARRLKRGGGKPLVSLDETPPEGRYALEPVDTMTADRIYERRWALTLLEQAMDRLREEFVRAGKETLFTTLRPYLTSDPDAAPYAAAAASLDMTEGAVKVAVHRLRHRYGEVLRAEIANTVAQETDVESELRHLMTVLSG